MTKSFDCVAYKERAQESILEDIEGMSAEERRDYFRRKAEGGLLGSWWRRVKSSGARGRAPRNGSPRQAEGH